MKKLIAIPFLLFAVFSFAQRKATYKCYNQYNSNKLKVQLKFYGDTAASVKYAGQKEAIPLVLVPGSRKDDSVFYNEKYNGKITGSYEMQYLEDGDFLVYTPKNEKKKYTYQLNDEKTFLPNSDKWRTTPCF